LTATAWRTKATPQDDSMSDTSKTEARRRRKKAAQGQDRKKKLEKLGTTPKFPLDPAKASQAKSKG
jgi:hypothetical protein